MPSRNKKSEKTSSVENITLLRSFCDRFYTSELVGAVLLVTDEEHVIHVLAAGVLPILSIKPPTDYFG